MYLFLLVRYSLWMRAESTFCVSTTYFSALVNILIAAVILTNQYQQLAVDVALSLEFLIQILRRRRNHICETDSQLDSTR
jgi:hypothetical protein